MENKEALETIRTTPRRLIMDNVNNGAEPQACAICDEPIVGESHNPEPVAASPKRCCNSCNENEVIPARIKRAMGE